MNTFLKSSRNPLDDINVIAYDGQPVENRMYKSGFEDYFEMLPVLRDEDPRLSTKITTAKNVMNALANELKQSEWTATLRPLPGKFNRTILGIESPKYTEDSIKEGQEIIVARWGDGKSSPVHGHADGLLYEQLLFGKMRVNTYRIVNHETRTVRPVETKIYKEFVNIAASYTEKQSHKRSALVHNFTSIGYSASLHFVPEHTRDGRDNGFNVEYFDREMWLRPENFTQLSSQQGIEQLRIGDVALVRSENVPEYGDHWIVITGKPILKEHGLRPQDTAIHAPYAARILNQWTPIMGLTLLKLDEATKQKFHEFHGIKTENGSIILPTA